MAPPSRATFFFLLLVAAASSAASFAGSPPPSALHDVPLLVWSPLPIASAKRSEVQSADVNAVSCFVDALKQPLSCKDGNLVALLAPNAAARPEVVVAFVHRQMSSPQLASALGAFSAPPTRFDRLTSGAAAIIEVPHVHVDENDAALPLSSRIRAGYHLDRLTLPQLRHRVAELQKDSVFTNGVTEVLLVTPPSDQSKFSLDYIEEAADVIAKAANNKFVAMLTADAPLKPMHLMFDVLADNAAAATAKVYNGPQYITAPILIGILLSLFLIGMLTCFFGHLADIETPLRFPRKQFEVSKEY